jgi:3-hydroxybutyryl-CoA dehydrogenase
MRFLCKKLVMQWMVLANEILKEELLSNGTSGEVDIIWIRNVEDFTQHNTADGYFDLLFDNTTQRIELLKFFLPKPIIINSVAFTLQKISAAFVRINGWQGFLKRSVVEASYNDERIKLQVDDFFSSLNKQTEWVKDKPGFITARVIAMIINEAYFTLGEGVSTKEEIDEAMKLGVNYPNGPFAWCNTIGIKNIYSLLNELSDENARYKPAPLLEKEAMA